MSNSGKLYQINLSVYQSLSAKVAKLPKQQQQILATMAKHCVDGGLKGSDIVDLAKKAGLETRQKSTVLYAWYARSNESFGVFSGTPIPAEPKLTAEQISEISTAKFAEILAVQPTVTVAKRK